MLKGAAKLAPPSSKQDLRQPVTVEIIARIKSQISDQPLDIAFFACLTMLFYSVARVGEFTTRRRDHFDPVENISLAGVRTESDRNGFVTTVFTLPRTKASTTGEEVQWVKQEGPTDPHDALQAHLASNDPPMDGPLFAYREGHSHRPLSKAIFLRRLKATAKAAGYDAVRGHGIRIGATLEYLLRGMPFDVMKVKGRWASDAFQLYLRKHNQILAPYIQAMPPSLAAEFTRLAMPPVR
ncbi:hypothetical protein ID866_11326 [Astraeus odoratus]|nr:hypothetical protein ID866_11326 [Astraeus odoratus]